MSPNICLRMDNFKLIIPYDSFIHDILNKVSKCPPYIVIPSYIGHFHFLFSVNTKV